MQLQLTSVLCATANSAKSIALDACNTYSGIYDCGDFYVLYVIFATISIYRGSDGVNTVSITSFNIANNFVRDILDVLKLTAVTPQLCDICKVTKSFILCSGIQLPSLEFAKIYPNFI